MCLRLKIINEVFYILFSILNLQNTVHILYLWHIPPQNKFLLEIFSTEISQNLQLLSNSHIQVVPHTLKCFPMTELNTDF